MKQNRFWLELVTLCAMASLSVAISLAALGGSAALALGKAQSLPAQKLSSDAFENQMQSVPTQSYQANDEQTFSGVLTDSTCGAKHDRKMNQSAAGCTKICLKKGASYALVDGDKVYRLQGNDQYLDRFAGERVTVSGVLSGHTITVSSVDGMNR